MLTNLIRLARPQDWIKNVFVLLPVPFALAAGSRFVPAAFLLGLAGFCLVNSAVYTLNDLFDAEADRLHPEKCRRPIAAGLVPVGVAAVQSIVLLSLGLGLCLAAGNRPTVMTIVLAYVVINLAYNLGVKHVALLDVFLLSSGFVIRVLLGCALVAAPPSPWLLLCTSTLALFLGFAKRRADLAEELDVNHRPSLRGYSKTFLDQAVSICAGVAHVVLRLVLHRSTTSVATRPRNGLDALRGLRNPELSCAWPTCKAPAVRRSTSPTIHRRRRSAPSAGSWR